MLVQLSKSMWAVTYEGSLMLMFSPTSMNYILKKGRWPSNGDDEVFYAGFGCCTFLPHRENKKQKLTWIELSYARKSVGWRLVAVLVLCHSCCPWFERPLHRNFFASFEGWELVSHRCSILCQKPQYTTSFVKPLQWPLGLVVVMTSLKRA